MQRLFRQLNHPDVITVSAIADKDGKCGGLGPSIWVDAGNMSGLADDDTFAQFSNYGSAIDIAAPGVKINSTYPNGTYALAGGTSVAAPHVSGTVALLKQALPHASPSEMETAVKKAGSTLSTVCDGNGHGYFDGDADDFPEPLLYTKFLARIPSNDMENLGARS